MDPAVKIDDNVFRLSSRRRNDDVTRGVSRETFRQPSVLLVHDVLY